MVISMIFHHMDRIVFAGDSVTDAGSGIPVGERDTIGCGYVRIIENLLSALYPEVCLRITNSGISGDTSRDLLLRWERDVRNLNPQWVSICIGINDVWRHFHAPALLDQLVSPKEYRENVQQMILSKKPHAKGIFLMTPYYMEPNQNDVVRIKMDEYGAICKDLAEENGCILIDLQAMFNHYCSIRHSSYLAWDRVHPNQIGATLIALEWLKHCELGRLQSEDHT